MSQSAIARSGGDYPPTVVTVYISNVAEVVGRGSRVAGPVEGRGSQSSQYNSLRPRQTQKSIFSGVLRDVVHRRDNQN